MEKTEAVALLKQLIREKEAEQKAEGELLKHHFRLTYESLKPLNIIKNTFKEIVSVPDLNAMVADTTMGITAGFLAKKILTGKSHNLFAKLAGVILEMIIAGKVTKNADEIKSIGSNIWKKIVSQYNDSGKV